MITKENWTHCIYKNPSAESTAQVSIGAMWESGDIQNRFYVSQFDSKHYAEYQAELSDLNEALEVINKRYKSWNFIDLEKVNKEKKSGGCDSCQAH